MKVYEVIWKERFVEKLADKHDVFTDEVEEILFSSPHVRMAEKRRIKGENMYAAYGQTGAGRYLVIFFIRKRRFAALPISARDMTPAERRYYHAQKKAN